MLAERDEMSGLLKDKDEELHEKDILIKALTSENLTINARLSQVE